MKRFVAVIALTFCACRGGPSVKPGPAFEVFPAARTEVAFKPPLGQVLRERNLTQRTDKAGAATSTATVELRTDSTWTQDGENFVLSQRVTLVDAVQDGKKIEDPLAQLVTKFSTKFSIAKDGTFVRFLNPEDARKAVLEAFADPDQAAEVLSFFTPEAIEDQARIEWEQKFGGLFGRAIEAERPMYVVEGTGVGSLPVLYVMERAFTGMAKTQFGEAAVFTLKCVQRSEDAKDREAFDRLMTERGSPSLEPTATCEGRQVVTREKFVPVTMELRLKAKPISNGAVVGELELWRSTTAEELM